MASFFAGVGGIDLGFEETGRVETVYANEFDPYPVKTFNLNFAIEADCRDIHDVQPDDFPDVVLSLAAFPARHSQLPVIVRDLRMKKEEELYFLN